MGCHRRCIIVPRKPTTMIPSHLSWDDPEDEDDYTLLDKDLDDNGCPANEIVLLPHYLTTEGVTMVAKRWHRSEVSGGGEAATAATAAAAAAARNDTREMHAWVMNLAHRNPGPERWLQMQQDAIGVFDVLFRLPAVDYGSAKGCGLSHIKVGSWWKAVAAAMSATASASASTASASNLKSTNHRIPSANNQPRPTLSGKTQKMPGITVLEDDATFPDPTSRERWIRAIDELPDDADVLLGGVHWSDSKGTRISEHMVKLKDFSATQQCLFRLSAYDKLQGFEKSHEVNIDRYMGAMAREGKLNVYLVLPFTSIQRAGLSHLRSSHTNDAHLFKTAEQNLLRLPITVGGVTSVAAEPPAAAAAAAAIQIPPIVLPVPLPPAPANPIITTVQQQTQTHVHQPTTPTFGGGCHTRTIQHCGRVLFAAAATQMTSNQTRMRAR